MIEVIAVGGGSLVNQGSCVISVFQRTCHRLWSADDPSSEHKEISIPVVKRFMKMRRG